MSEEEYLKFLQETYAFCVMLYSLSFKERIRFELGTLRISTSPDDVIRAWPKEYLEKELRKLKKPWWNWLFTL